MFLLHSPDAEELQVSDLHFPKSFESETKPLGYVPCSYPTAIKR